MSIESSLLEAAEVRELSRLSPWRSLGQGVLEWTWIVLIILLAQRADSIMLYPLWVLLIGSRQHALAILMHDSAHSRTHPNRRWNDLIGEVLFAWPLATSLRVYRRTHLAHHQHLQTPLDVDWRIWRDHAYYWFPKTRRALLGEIAAFCMGLRTLELFRFIRNYANRDARPEKLRLKTSGASEDFSTRLDRFRLPFYGLALLTITLLGAWQTIALYWIVPLLTALMAALYIRAIAEHFISANGGPEALPCSRSMKYNWLERVLVAPLNVGYHLEHHLYPSVPFYQLGELHRRLMRVDLFRERARITHGVNGVIRECENSLSTRELWQRQQARA